MNKHSLLTATLYVAILLLSVCRPPKHRSGQTENKDSVSVFRRASFGKWQAIGPFGSPIPAADSGIFSPHGTGRFLSVNVHPSDNNEILAGHATAGLFKSTDGGETWTQKLQFEFSCGISSIYRFKNNNRHLLACASLDIGNSRQYGYGLLESFDNGENWKRNSLQFDPEEYKREQCRDVCAADKSENRLICISDKQIYLSENGGLNWKSVYSGDYLLKSIHPDPEDEKTILICGNGFLKSTDGGRSWQDLSRDISQFCGTALSRYSGFAAAFSAAKPAKAYVAFQSGRVQVIEMDMKGNGYKLINRNACTPNAARLCLAVEAGRQRHEETLWLGTVRLFKSKNGGQSFEQCGTPATGAPNHMHDDINSLQPESHGRVLVCTDGGIDISIDQGLNWTSLCNNSRNLNGGMVFGFDISPAGTIMCGTQDNGIWVFKNGKWTCSRLYGDGGRAVSCGDSNSFYCGFAQMNHFTPDAGRTFSYQHAGSEKTGFEFRMQYLPGSRSIYIANMHLYRKYGSRYFELLSGGSKDDRKISAFTVNPDDENEIWICREDASWGAEPQNKILHSVNGGASWTDVSRHLPALRWRSISDICMNKAGEIAIALDGFDKNGGESQRVYISYDGGNSFVNLSAGLPNLPVNTIVHSGSNWYCGTNNGVYTLSNGIWQRFGEGLPACIITELRYYKKESVLAAASFGRGIWISRAY